MKRTISSIETTLPAGTDARTLLLALDRSHFAHEYFLYASDDETRIALGCQARIAVGADGVTLRTSEGRVVSEPASDPFAQVERLMRGVSDEPWTAYGYVSFDCARHYLPYGPTPEIPELAFVVPRAEIVVKGSAVTLRDGARLGALRELVESLKPVDAAAIGEPVVPSVDHALRGGYESKVTRLTTAIQNGELAKAILSRRVVFDGALDVPATYLTAARVNSAVRSFAFRMDEAAGVGFSPEVLLEASSDGRVTTSLLAGTRARGETPERDEALRAELFASAKEVKEHAISVQLAQEEVAAVCDPASVRIFEFMSIKRFRSVQHLASKVSGKLREGQSGWDALRVLFPAITVAGVPKAPALKSIGELEEHPRGIYAGVVGFVDSTGKMDLTLAIRSAFEYGGRIHLNAGAGIVKESDPSFEYVESVNKMKMMLGQTVLVTSEAAE